MISVDKSTKKFRVKRLNINYSGLTGGSPKQKINHVIQDEAEIHPIIRNIYRHIFAGGTIDQIDYEDMVILILNRMIKRGVFRRKSTGTLYDRNIVYINKITGELTLRSPSHWGNLDIGEVEERLNEMEQYKLT